MSQPPAHAPHAAPVQPVGEPGFGIYIHWPFCQSKCPYCDFNSHVTAGLDTAAWQQAMLTALEWFAARSKGWHVTSVFFGGGTPSLMPPALVSALLERIAARWPLADDVEITLEANPTSAEADKFAAFAAAGVNRLSLGVQALDNAALRLLGRTHDVADALRAWDLARKHFARTSFDLIYARPGQTPDAWAAELEQALALQPRHLSAYQLTMEPETPFYRLHARGRLPLPDEDVALQMYDCTERMLAAAGLTSYEVSNYARADAQCRHNLLYWRYGPYAGIGPGAHARLIEAQGQRMALQAIRHPQRWLQTVLQNGDAGLEQQEPLQAEAVATEYLLMSLRTGEGADLNRLQAISALQVEASILQQMQSQGLLHAPALQRIATTRRGRLVLERLLVELVSALRPAAPRAKAH